MVSRSLIAFSFPVAPALASALSRSQFYSAALTLVRDKNIKNIRSCIGSVLARPRQLVLHSTARRRLTVGSDVLAAKTVSCAAKTVSSIVLRPDVVRQERLLDEYSFLSSMSGEF